MTSSYLCARTCDSGSSLTHVLRGLNTQPYTDDCCLGRIRASLISDQPSNMTRLHAWMSSHEDKTRLSNPLQSNNLLTHVELKHLHDNGR